jgi:hypothetical protein
LNDLGDYPHEIRQLEKVQQFISFADDNDGAGDEEMMKQVVVIHC